MFKHHFANNMTVAIAENCEYEAIRLIIKRVPMILKVFGTMEKVIDNMNNGNDAFSLRYALMSSKYKVKVTCHQEDEYNKEVGIAEADKKLRRKIELATAKAIRRWQEHVGNDIERLEVKLNNYRGIEHFQAEKVRDAIVKEIADIGLKKVVIGISGGKDSTICAALVARAIGAENVYGVLLPNGDQEDIDDSYRVIKALGIHDLYVNIDGAYYKMITAVNSTMAKAKVEVTHQEEAEINIAPRLRMTALRYISQSIGARLCGTGNLSERYVGYCTKDGDTSCDFNPIGLLTCDEVVAIGLTMPEIPNDLIVKEPADGLSGMSDEEKLGVTYKEIHDYIRNNGKDIDELTDAQIFYKYVTSEHKRQTPPLLLSDEDNIDLDPKYWGLI